MTADRLRPTLTRTIPRQETRNELRAESGKSIFSFPQATNKGNWGCEKETENGRFNETLGRFGGEGVYDSRVSELFQAWLEYFGNEPQAQDPQEHDPCVGFDPRSIGIYQAAVPVFAPLSAKLKNVQPGTPGAGSHPTPRHRIAALALAGAGEQAHHPCRHPGKKTSGVRAENRWSGNHQVRHLYR